MFYVFERFYYNLFFQSLYNLYNFHGTKWPVKCRSAVQYHSILQNGVYSRIKLLLTMAKICPKNGFQYCSRCGNYPLTFREL